VPGLAHHRVRTLQRIALWIGLGGWIGALLLCGGVVVGAAFQEVGDPQVAARLVGRVLGPVQLAGIALGVALSALGGAMGRGRIAVALPLLLAGLCAVNHFGVSPAVAAIDLGDPAAGPGAGLRFARLHQLSVGLFVAVAIGTILLALMHVARELREDRPGHA
jgi:hypothetical protein